VTAPCSICFRASWHAPPVAENLLNRQFNPPAANQAWAADITYIRQRAGWLYLAAVLDLYSRKVVGWAMPASLVCTALQIAIAQRQPAPRLMVHSDQVSQYASADYQALVSRHGRVCSMSRQGNCWDNALMERFFLNLKMARVWRRDYANAAEAMRAITDYSVGFYNSTRLPSTPGYRPASVFARESPDKTPILVSRQT
jgi:putative transposase